MTDPARPGQAAGAGRRSASVTAAAAALAAAGGLAAQEAALDVPSGQPVRYVETVHSAPGPEGLTLRFRFVAPAIARDAGGVDAETAQADMEWLCNAFALPRLPATGPRPAQIIISLADREVAFGEPAPEVTQFFEAFTVEGDHCVWEAF
jgi:hypothetical protein